MLSVLPASASLPAASMVTTTSAPLTEPTALSAIPAPSALACSREAATRSNAPTLWPALTRLAAIGPPILPRPMNAIVAILVPPLEPVSVSLLLLTEHQFVGADLGEVWRNHRRCHVLDFRWRPFRIAVLVDDSRPHALAKIVASEHFQGGTILPHQAFLQRGRVTRQPQQLQRHHHAARRFLRQRLQGRLRQLRTVALEAIDDIL